MMARKMARQKGGMLARNIEKVEMIRSIQVPLFLAAITPSSMPKTIMNSNPRSVSKTVRRVLCRISPVRSR